MRDPVLLTRDPVIVMVDNKESSPINKGPCNFNGK